MLTDQPSLARLKAHHRGRADRYASSTKPRRSARPRDPSRDRPQSSSPSHLVHGRRPRKPREEDPDSAWRVLLAVTSTTRELDPKMSARRKPKARPLLAQPPAHFPLLLSPGSLPRSRAARPEGRFNNPSAEGHYQRDSNWNRRTWTTIRADAALPDVDFHDLRHFLASHAASADLAPELRRQYLGHSDARTHDDYIHAIPARSYSSTPS